MLFIDEGLQASRNTQRIVERAERIAADAESAIRKLLLHIFCKTTAEHQDFLRMLNWLRRFADLYVCMKFHV